MVRLLAEVIDIHEAGRRSLSIPATPLNFGKDPHLYLANLFDV